MTVCTVIGFPNGYMTTETKEFETRNALENRADEIDMVINNPDGSRIVFTIRSRMKSAD